MDEVEEHERLFERVAGIDIAKSEVKVCVRVPGNRSGYWRQEVRTFPAVTAELLALGDWLRIEQVQLVVMEATGTYWKPVFYALEDDFECWLLNAKQVKHLPGRPKTDREDAIWLAKVAERGMARPSFVPPKPIRHLRDLIRYRRSLTQERTREKQRVQGVLEDAQVKLSSVISDIHGASGRAMLEAMIAGQRNPHELAQLARGSMRGKKHALTEALRGHFNDHHAFICRMMLDNIDRLSGQIDALTRQIEHAIAPYQPQVEQLDEVTGIGPIAAQDIIAEIGVDMSRFATAGHLVSWARFCPQTTQSGGKPPRGGATGKGNPWLGAALGEIASSARRTRTFLGARYRRIARRRGAKKALVATAHSVLTIIWHLLSDPEAHYQDLGPDHYDSRINTDRRTRQLARHLEALTGQKITIEDGKITAIGPDYPT
jgi:transposase